MIDFGKDRNKKNAELKKKESKQYGTVPSFVIFLIKHFHVFPHFFNEYGTGTGRYTVPVLGNNNVASR